MVVNLPQCCQAFSNLWSYLRSYENYMESALVILTLAYVVALFCNVHASGHLARQKIS